ncbi:MAG TPA: flagellar hook capping FlgD N-terminal domain-containing protein [Tepidisphaeraceae bacterium]|jgi:flagellar basal-body rod modification protein FlgD|nr:flagellar hook capping FlgD N-terminal domain-containing protein [Tepidisphaeraceae bacterium]
MPETSTMSTTIPSLTSTPASSTTGATTNANLNLTPTDFLNMMVQQLQNQDPLNPTSSSDLLAQMSQIGQLQSSTSLQTTLGNFGTQTSLSSASSMIGKSVTGTDANSNPLSGVVTSVQVAGGNVSLELDNGTTMPLANVATIAAGPSGTTASTGTSTTPAVGG